MKKTSFGLVLAGLLAALNAQSAKDSGPPPSDYGSTVQFRQIQRQGEGYVLKFAVNSGGSVQDHQVTDDDGLLTVMTLNRYLVQKNASDVYEQKQPFAKIAERDVGEWKQVQPLLMTALNKTISNYSAKLKKLQNDRNYAARFPSGTAVKLTSALNALRLKSESLKDKTKISAGELDESLGQPMQDLVKSMVGDDWRSRIQYSSEVGGIKSKISFPDENTANPIGSVFGFHGSGTLLRPNVRSRSYSPMYLPKNQSLGKIIGDIRDAESDPGVSEPESH